MNNRVGIVNKDLWYSLSDDESKYTVYSLDGTNKSFSINREQIYWSLFNIDLLHDRLIGSDTGNYFTFDSTGNMIIVLRNSYPLLSIFVVDSLLVTLQTDRDIVFLQLGNNEYKMKYRNNGLLLGSEKSNLFIGASGEKLLLLRDLDRDYAVGGGDYHCLNLKTGEIVRLKEFSKIIRMYQFLGIAEKSQAYLFR